MSAGSELTERLAMKRPYVVIRHGSDQNQNNMVVEKTDSNSQWLFGKVALNRFVIVAMSAPGAGARMFIGSKDEAMRDGVLAFDECVYASKLEMRARTDHLDIVEDNWRVFLDSDIVDGDGNIKDMKKLGEKFPRLKQQLDAMGVSKHIADASGTTVQFPPRMNLKPGGAVEPPFVPAPAEEDSSLSEDHN